MKLIAYLEKYDLRARVEQVAADIIGDISHYKVMINYRAKGRYGCVKHSKALLEITNEYYVNGKVKEGEEADHENTLLHETAHIIVRARYGKVKPHGIEWKRVMRSLGAKADRCGTSTILMEAKTNNRSASRNHVYTCKDCGYEVKRTRPMKNATIKYHRGCRHKINRGTLAYKVVS